MYRPRGQPRLWQLEYQAARSTRLAGIFPGRVDVTCGHGRFYGMKGRFAGDGRSLQSRQSFVRRCPDLPLHAKRRGKNASKRSGSKRFGALFGAGAVCEWWRMWGLRAGGAFGSTKVDVPSVGFRVDESRRSCSLSVWLKLTFLWAAAVEDDVDDFFV